MSAINVGRGRTPSAGRMKAVANAASKASAGSGEWLGEAASKTLLAHHGVAVPAGGTASDTAGCLAIAAEVGYPVALKLSGPEIQHKSEFGAVALGIDGAAELTLACERLLALPAAQGAELLVERMVEPGLELIVSASSDSIVPNLVIGLGGIWTEVMNDAVVIPLPAEAERMPEALLSLKSAAIFTGGRGTDAVDLSAIADLAERCGQALIEEGLTLIELNPVIVNPAGAVAADAISSR